MLEFSPLCALIVVYNMAIFLGISFAPNCQALTIPCRPPGCGCRKQSGADVKGVTRYGR